jgi:hypothetical protein
MTSLSRSRTTCALRVVAALSGCGLYPSLQYEPVAQDRVAEVAHPIRTCVIRAGELIEVAAEVDSATGDTLVGGQPISEVFPLTSPPYLSGADWYTRFEPIRYHGRRYHQYGLPRQISVAELQKVGEYRGVVLFTELGARRDPEVYYALLRPGCWFQVYQNT